MGEVIVVVTIGVIIAVGGFVVGWLDSRRKR